MPGLDRAAGLLYRASGRHPDGTASIASYTGGTARVVMDEAVAVVADLLSAAARHATAADSERR